MYLKVALETDEIKYKACDWADFELPGNSFPDRSYCCRVEMADTLRQSVPVLISSSRAGTD